MKKIAVLTSGGDAPGMNAAIRAVVRAGINSKIKVMGIERGFSGLINGEIKEMNLSSVGDIIHRGGTILKTARCEEFKTVDGRNKGHNVLKGFGIEGLVVIGGDGSFLGAQKLCHEGVPTIGIPGTIDNDMPYTDYTIGFDTAVNTVLDAINKIRDTCMSHEKVSIIEVMGRHCGDIALYAGLAGGAENILIPEEKSGLKKICEKLIKGKARGKLYHIIVLAEGIGNASELQKEVFDKTGIEARITTLGYTQRGGNPTASDRILASRMGAKAVELLLNKQSGRAIGVKGNQLIHLSIDEALSAKKKFNRELYALSQVLSI
ncbi:6-phosphofructokinase 1 [Anaerosolibacter carboniphilus]|uniref:ATP-dependent 6-phosphofructokinase n=1 Tax=Anaerosolibacter carboniphilus TaxID=1417629 RepID=A0A841KV07_9FIRM|nr:6-phosphofructokinase [Anaerosolibacter carboniphilus]MBB6217291.1 6-phosphofructokinase 1 [Anaerosolibacter carboniphilus]